MANYDSKNVSVIDTATDTVIATIEVGYGPIGLTVTPDGKRYMWQTRTKLSL